GGPQAGEAKRRLAREIVARYHGEGAGRAAEERFDRVHKDREAPTDVPTESFRVEDANRIWLPAVLVQVGLAGSNSEARRLSEQGGVRVNGETVTDPAREFSSTELSDALLQVGRRRFVRI